MWRRAENILWPSSVKRPPCQQHEFIWNHCMWLHWPLSNNVTREQFSVKNKPCTASWSMRHFACAYEPACVCTCVCVWTRTQRPSYKHTQISCKAGLCDGAVEVVKSESTVTQYRTRLNHFKERLACDHKVYHDMLQTVTHVSYTL